MIEKSGCLIVVATPIGNLKDMSLRAVEVLREADYIAAEDTRHSGKLLKTYEIETKMISLHKFNEVQKRAYLLELLQNGNTVALISDAGTPGICDPGEDLIRACIEENIDITAVPGANAALTALVLSGFDSAPFTFYGFFPKKNAEKTVLLQAVAQQPHTAIFYESPHRLANTLSLMKAFIPHRRICLCRELTKLHEEILRGTAEELASHYRDKTVKGEIVLVLEGAPPTEESMDLARAKQLVEQKMREGETKNEAIRQICRKYPVSRKDLYRLFIDD